MLEEAQRVLDISPLSLILSARQPGGEFVGKLLGLLLLLVVSDTFDQVCKM